MHQSKASAIILHTGDIFDADRMYLLFTREYGKFRARAKGVRRPKSRLAGNLQSYVPTRLELIAGTSGWELIVQAHTEHAAPLPENPLEFLQYAELIAEAIDKLLPDREPHPELFDGLTYTFQRLSDLSAKDPATLFTIVSELLWKLLIVMGYRPELERCVVTGEPLTPQGLGWSSQIGGVVSEEGMRQLAVPSRPVHSSKTIVALRQLAKPEFVAERLTMDPEIRNEVCQIVFDYLQTQIGKPLKSYQVLARI